MSANKIDPVCVYCGVVVDLYPGDDPLLEYVCEKKKCLDRAEAEEREVLSE